MGVVFCGESPDRVECGSLMAAPSDANLLSALVTEVTTR